MDQPTAANSHWLAALLSSLLLFNLLHTIGADEAFSCPNGKLDHIFPAQILAKNRELQIALATRAWSADAGVAAQSQSQKRCA